MTKMQRASAAAYRAITGWVRRTGRTILCNARRGSRHMLDSLHAAALPARAVQPVPIRVETRDRCPGGKGRSS